MTAVILRSALEHWGHNPPPELAYIVRDHRASRVVTWRDVMQARRERQAEQLRRKREVGGWRAYKLWVAFFDQNLMGGWQAFLETYGNVPYYDQRVWVDRDRQHLRCRLMALFPLVLPLGTEWEQWEAWKPAFASAFKRRIQDDQPLGVAYVWWDRGYSLLRKMPEVRP
jgi:hypothetical protein